MSRERKKGSEQGQSLVEIVYILGMVVILLTGLITAIIFSIKAARYSRNKANATRIARELIEEKKSQKQEDSFWESVSGYTNDCSAGDWQCESEAVSLPFHYYLCYCGYSSSDGEKSISLQARVWWDSAAEPSLEKKNMVLVETSLSNWEQ